MTRRITPLYVLNILLLTLLALIFLFPILIGFLNSFKSFQEIFLSTLSLPKSWSLDNYITVFQRIKLLRSTGNTAIVSALAIAGIVLFGAMAGYKLSRTRTKYSTVIFLLFISSMLVPFHAIMIPLYQMASKLQLKGHLPGLSVLYIGLGVSLSIFMFHGFTKSISREMEEAASIDGSSEFGTFFRIILPLLRPAMGTIIVQMFIWTWNDYLLPVLMLLDMRQFTIVLSVNTLFGEYGNQWNLILPALIMAVIPVIIIYIFFQRYIMQGVLEGAIKG
ncbi:MAG: carbohydrate ABC transporter permease [Eubacteriales bacterium]|nr:carbohydrate ABC transporter permease [Eubacteriales bacterium]